MLKDRMFSGLRRQLNNENITSSPLPHPTVPPSSIQKRAVEKRKEKRTGKRDRKKDEGINKNEKRGGRRNVSVWGCALRTGP